MKKKTYQQPEIMVVELNQTDIICVSASTEGLGDGGDLFSAKSLYFDEEDDFLDF